MYPAFSRKGNLQGNSYFLSSSDCFFYRFADSGFRNKWTGFWSEENKFLEYFALSLGDEYLSPQNCRLLEYDGTKAVHEYETGPGRVTETLFLPDGRRALCVSLRLPAEAELEVAVNIRRRVENVTGRKYQLKPTQDGFLIANPLGKLRFRMGSGSMHFSRNMQYRTHWPSGEEESFVVPGKIGLSGKKVSFEFSLDDSRAAAGELRRKETSYARLVEGSIKSDNRDLVRGFTWSVLGLEMLRKRFGKSYCYYAGLPWFQQFWGRDLFWVTQSLLSLGRFQDVRQSLAEFAAKADSGRIPNFLAREANAWNAIDATLLWIITLRDYVFWSGDTRFLGEMMPFLKSSLRYLFSRERDGFLQHDADASETWMDTLRRGESAIEIQALYYKALRSSEELLANRREDDLLQEAGRKAVMLGNSFDGRYWNGSFYADRISGGGQVNVRTPNFLVPLAFGMGSHWKEGLAMIESPAFTTPRGVRTRAEGEHDYYPWEYHSGEVWSLTTAWASAAEFAHGRPSKGWGYMKTLVDDMESDALGCVGECWNAADMHLTGCGLQLWGSGFMPRLVDEFMLGIRPDALSGTVKVSPNLPPSVRKVSRRLLIGRKKGTISFSSGSAKCSISGVKVVKG